MEDAIFDIQQALIMQQSYRENAEGMEIQLHGSPPLRAAVNARSPSLADIIEGINPALAEVVAEVVGRAFCDGQIDW